MPMSFGTDSSLKLEPPEQVLWACKVVATVTEGIDVSSSNRLSRYCGTRVRQRSRLIYEGLKLEPPEQVLWAEEADEGAWGVGAVSSSNRLSRYCGEKGSPAMHPHLYLVSSSNRLSRYCGCRSWRWA